METINIIHKYLTYNVILLVLSMAVMYNPIRHGHIFGGHPNYKYASRLEKLGAVGGATLKALFSTVFTMLVYILMSLPLGLIFKFHPSGYYDLLIIKGIIPDYFFETHYLRIGIGIFLFYIVSFLYDGFKEPDFLANTN